ncbi:hypothetical protein QFC22_000008 [Naganishia vaughanmartiniae]|uniref:Uncharacterized protein n=1 Tax=Naganishia vaughanmartiniae TaxID=1424756 RepID=A0ACC2XNW1_9TREE|nr:hypothetical protein QFC22_000008 [Naganishia vaughanmartiniae]
MSSLASTYYIPSAPIVPTVGAPSGGGTSHLPFRSEMVDLSGGTASVNDKDAYKAYFPAVDPTVFTYDGMKASTRDEELEPENAEADFLKGFAENPVNRDGVPDGVAPSPEQDRKNRIAAQRAIMYAKEQSQGYNNGLDAQAIQSNLNNEDAGDSNA